MFRALALLALVGATWAVKCKYDGNDLENNQIIVIQNAFRLMCITESNGSWRTEIIGCVAPDGTEIDAGDKKENGDKVHECKKSEGGQVFLKESKGLRAPCASGHKHGEQWQDKSFKFECVDGGVTKFIACVGQDGTVIPSGTTGKIGGFEVKCEQHSNGTITMQAANDPKSYECKAKDGSLKKNGVEYVEGNFVRKCEDYGRGMIIGCFSENVTGTIPINQNVTQGAVTYSCSKDGQNYSFKTFAAPQDPKVYAMCGYNGQTYQNGSTFISQGSFRMRCLTFDNLTSTLVPISCITPNGIEIAVGQTIEENDKTYECTPGNVTMKVSAGQNGLCRNQYSVGAVWREDSFMLTCAPYGKVEVKACISKQGIEIPLGTSKRVPEGYAMECVLIDGNVALRAAKDFDCETKDKEVMKFGETWNEGNFVRRCENYGVSSIIGCYQDGYGSIDLNRNVTMGNRVLMCINENGQFQFRIREIEKQAEQA